jgi:hypothetical protein
MHEKLCFKCNIVKPLSEFYKHPQMADGRLGKCKECTKKDTSKREAMLSKVPEWKEKELARHREKSSRARACGKVSSREICNKGQRAWYQRNKEKKYAHGCVSNALKSGKLTRQPCEVCNEPRVQAHHDDYSKPLDVKWLCVKHHAERHIELNRLNRKYE